MPHLHRVLDFRVCRNWTIGIIRCIAHPWKDSLLTLSPLLPTFAGYIYPDNIGDGGVCDMYQGVPCTVDTSQCCYNEDVWCPNGAPACDRYDRAAYPFGDKVIYPNSLTDPTAFDPFPNAILWNWATIIILAFGNVAALDFQARCMAARSPTVARRGCLLGGCVTLIVGIPFSFLGSLTRVHYGPDSEHGELEADSCSLALGLPTCALWLPDDLAFVKMLTHQIPALLGAWCMIGIVAASMSTADGAILSMGTVVSHNVLRQLEPWFPTALSEDNLLHMARVATLPAALMSGCIAAFYKGPGGTGYLLIVAFDIVFATVIVPLFGAFYAKKPSPRAALLSVVAGGLSRILLEFALPKDGSLLLPFDELIFYHTGPAASSSLPNFIDAPTSDHWDPALEPCHQELAKDYTGVDSLAAAFLSLVIFLSIQTVENYLQRPLFAFWGDQPYIKKDLADDPTSKHNSDEISNVALVKTNDRQEEAP